MRIGLDLRDAFVEELARKDKDLSRTVLEALAIDVYRRYSFGEFERQERNQCRLWQKRLEKSGAAARS